MKFTNYRITISFLRELALLYFTYNKRSNYAINLTTGIHKCKYSQ